MELTPIPELGVAEAYAILVGRLGETGLPPLDAIENEDWGRDLLLSRFEPLSDEALADVGLTRDHAWDRRGGSRLAASTAPGADDPGGGEVGAVVGDDPEA